VIRHKIVDMTQKVAVTQAWLEILAWRLGQGESPVAEICMLKNQATQSMAFCASEAVADFRRRRLHARGQWSSASTARSRSMRSAAAPRKS